MAQPLDVTLAELRETYRMHQDLVRAQTRLTLQIKAVQRRLAADPSLDGDREKNDSPYGLPPDGHAPDDRTAVDRPITDNHTPIVDGPCCEPPGQTSGATLQKNAGRLDPIGDDGHTRTVTQIPCAVVADLATLPLTEARNAIHAGETKLRKRLERMAQTLPGWSTWAKDVTGLGPFSYAALIAEAGDVTLYRNPAKLWKRFGLAVFDGKAQRRIRDAELAELMGFSPQRRAVAFVIGDCLLRRRSPGFYELYLARKAYEEAQHPELTLAHRHRRAKRYMEKRVLRELWRAWRDAIGDGAQREAA